tara:strand:+ start:128 stop:793 length:666 start_codon:yes stop_codon:yes gene_type:complete
MSEDTPKGHQDGDADTKITFGKVGSFLRSTWSKGFTGKKADDNTKYLRSVSCHGDKSLDISPCEWRRESEKAEGIYFCGRCGCGDSPKTWLNGPEGEYTKLDYPQVVCPLEMPGFSNHKPYGQEESDLAKEFVTARKMNVEFTLFGKGIDIEHYGTLDLNVEEVKEPELPKRCKHCGKPTPIEDAEGLHRPCGTCGKKNVAQPRPTPEQRVNNSVDEPHMG